MAAGHDLDQVLERFARIPPSAYRALGADVLPIEQFHVLAGGRRR